MKKILKFLLIAIAFSPEMMALLDYLKHLNINMESFNGHDEVDNLYNSHKYWSVCLNSGYRHPIDEDGTMDSSTKLPCIDYAPHRLSSIWLTLLSILSREAIFSLMSLVKMSLGFFLLLQENYINGFLGLCL